MHDTEPGRDEDRERLTAYEVGDSDQDLALARHLAALANGEGGVVEIGVRRDGTATGLAPDVVSALVDNDLAERLAPHLDGDRLTLAVTTWSPPVPAAPTAEPGNGVEDAAEDPRPPGPVVVRIRVGPAPEPPIVVGPDHEVVVRRRGRTEPARRDDHRRWRREAVEELRRELHQRLTLVVDAEPGSRVRVIGPDEVRDEPGYFLSRATDVFGQQPGRLLSAPDLIYLWRHREQLHIGPASVRLLVHSALRKRATLYPWLAVLPVSTEQIRRYVFEVVEMRDRDKSDAARAVLLLSALYLSADDYQALVEALSASSYAHMREAAVALPDVAAAHRQLAVEAGVGGGTARLKASSDLEVLAMIDELLAEGSSAPRRVSALGLELLQRRLTLARGDAATAEAIAAEAGTEVG